MADCARGRLFLARDRSRDHSTDRSVGMSATLAIEVTDIRRCPPPSTALHRPPTTSPVRQGSAARDKTRRDPHPHSSPPMADRGVGGRRVAREVDHTVSGSGTHRAGSNARSWTRSCCARTGRDSPPGAMTGARSVDAPVACAHPVSYRGRPGVLRGVPPGARPHRVGP